MVTAATSPAEAGRFGLPNKAQPDILSSVMTRFRPLLFHPRQAIVVVGLALAAVVVPVIALFGERQRVAPQSLRGL